MDVKAVANIQATVQTNAQSAEATGKEIQKMPEVQNESGKPSEVEEINSKPPSQEELSSVIKDIQEKLNLFNGELEITTDEQSGIKVVKIIEKNTDKVIRQIPSEAVLKIARYLDEIAGLLYNEKV